MIPVNTWTRKQNRAMLPKTWCHPAEAGISSFMKCFTLDGNPVRSSSHSTASGNLRDFMHLPCEHLPTSTSSRRSWSRTDRALGAQGQSEPCHQGQKLMYDRDR